MASAYDARFMYAFLLISSLLYKSRTILPSCSSSHLRLPIILPRYSAPETHHFPDRYYCCIRRSTQESIIKFSFTFFSFFSLVSCLSVFPITSRSVDPTNLNPCSRMFSNAWMNTIETSMVVSAPHVWNGHPVNVYSRIPFLSPSFSILIIIKQNA